MAKPLYYMHTIDGSPAYFDGEQIVYADRRRAAVLVVSLTEIRRQQTASDEYRRSHGFSTYGYGYVLVSAP